MSNSDVEATIVITTKNRKEDLLWAVRSCLDQVGVRLEVLVIDRYNGLLAMPNNSESLLLAISSLVTNPSLREELGQRAYETARAAFCRNVWEAKWRNILEVTAGE